MRARLLFVAPMMMMGLGGCGGDGGATPPIDAPPGVDAPAAGATAHFDPPTPAAGAAWGAVPYPSDLVLDATGHQKLLTLPVGAAAAPASVTALIDGLATLDGAGVRSNVYFPIDGALTEASVTAAVATLIDVEASTASQLVTLPAEVLWRDDLGAIVVAPRLGVVLRAGHRYGAILTRAVRDAAGQPLAAAPDFVAAADLTATPSDPAIAAAQTSLRPLLELLPAATRAEVVAATVFRTATSTDDTRAMRDVIAAAPPPTITIDAVYGPGETGVNGLQALVGAAVDDAVPGTDVNNHGGQPHNHVALIIHGTIRLPNFQSATTGEDGYPVKTNGTWQIKANHPVKFTLSLPRTASWTNLPVAVFVHGLGRTRLDMLTQINTAARQGMAVIAIDLNKHGSRAVNPTDTINELLGTATPDGFGDGGPIGVFAPVQFFHLLGSSGGIPAGHPIAVGENLRQAALDLCGVVEYIADGDIAPLLAAITPIGGVPHILSFRGDLALVTESLGGMIATVALAVEPRLTTAYLASAAAGLPFPAMMHSPNYGETFLSVLTTPFGLDRITLYDAKKDARFDPIVAMYDSVVERGDSMAFAPDLGDGRLRGGTPPNLVMTMSWGDVWVSNDSTESLVAAIGLPHMAMTAPTPAANPVRYVTLAPTTSPVSGNRGGGTRTGAFVVWNPAGHAALRKREEQRNFMPIFPPVVAQNPVELIPNTQAAEIHEVLGALFADFVAGRTPVVRDPYAN